MRGVERMRGCPLVARRLVEERREPPAVFPNHLGFAGCEAEDAHECLTRLLAHRATVAPDDLEELVHRARMLGIRDEPFRKLHPNRQILGVLRQSTSQLVG